MQYFLIIYYLVLIILGVNNASEAFCPLRVFGAGVGAVDAVRTGDMYYIGVWAVGFVLSLIYYLIETGRLAELNAFGKSRSKSLSNRYVLLTSAAASCVALLVISSMVGIIYGLAVPILKSAAVKPEVVTKTGIFVFLGGIAGIAGAFVASYAACV